MFLFYACSNGSESNDVNGEEKIEQTSDQDVAKKSVNGDEIKEDVAKRSVTDDSFYLEDFAKFENHQQIEEHFGRENVVMSERWEAEGTELYLITEVFPNQNHSVIVFWDQDAVSHQGFSYVKSFYKLYDSNWEKITKEGKPIKSKTGVKVGDNIKQLKELNGKSFDFYGLGWDYGGNVINLQPKFDKLLISLNAPADFMESQQGQNKVNKIMGDRKISSDDKVIKDIPLFISSITYRP